jgi:hypothetical protein
VDHEVTLRVIGDMVGEASFGEVDLLAVHHASARNLVYSLADVDVLVYIVEHDARMRDQKVLQDQLLVDHYLSRKTLTGRSS